MNALSMNFVAQMSIERLLNCVAEGTAIALFAWLMLRLIGRRNSGTRFAVWFSTLIAIALVPFVELPAAATPIAHSSGAAITMPRAWSLYLFGIWAAIAAIGLARVAVGLWHLRSIRKNCEQADLASLDPTLVQTLADFRSARSVELCVSDTLHVPTAVGFFSPAVVLPAWTLRDLSSEELNTVVLHELAHLRRWDDWTNLAQKVLRAVFFFHPAVWFVENRLSLEREMACDDLVLTQTANPRAYAQCLVSLAEKNLLQRGVALAQAAVGRMKQTTVRVLQILDVRRSKTVSVWKPAPWVVAGFSVVCLIGAEHAPRLVAFGDSTRAQVDSSIAEYPAGAQSYAPMIPASFVTHDDRSYSAKRNRATKEKTLRSTPTRRAEQNVHKSDSRRALYRASMADLSAPPIIPASDRVMQTQTQTNQTAALMRTSAEEIGTVAVMQQTVFVVVEHDPSGIGGPVLWRVSVWQVTVVPRTGPRVLLETSSKSI
jgi:beta-lactamase regulating signal transducer with metallopeptidase domain